MIFGFSKLEAFFEISPPLILGSLFRGGGDRRRRRRVEEVDNSRSLLYKLILSFTRERCISSRALMDRDPTLKSPPLPLPQEATMFRSIILALTMSVFLTAATPLSLTGNSTSASLVPVDLGLTMISNVFRSVQHRIFHSMLSEFHDASTSSTTRSSRWHCCSWSHPWP